jgi:shikimate dehydrogenase
LAAVIGHPVAHSLSPAIHTAGFASIGADWQYLAFDVAPGSADAALAAMRTLGIGGLSVTMPHKEQVAECVDRLDALAAALRSVNTVSLAADGSLVGHSTDGAGLVAALAASGCEPADDYDVCVVGAGAAARSIVDALGRRTAGEVVVVNRSPLRAEACAALAGRGRVGDAADIAGAAVVVNATSVGMGSAEVPFDPALLHAGQVVIDIVYHPLRTALLEAAEARGCTTIDGLGMLVHQAALQQQHWLGRLPDVRAMRAAAEAELVARGH